MPSRDLATRDDLEHLLREFYRRAFQDQLLRHVFVDVVDMDLEAHLPVIADFWETVLFDTGTYRGQPMRAHRRVHQRVPLTGEHFTRWLALWRESVAASFAGPVAEQAVEHAERMARAFRRNLTEPRRDRLPVVPQGLTARR